MIPDVVRVASNPDTSSMRVAIRALAKEDAPRRSIRGDEHWIKVVATLKKRQQNPTDACSFDGKDGTEVSTYTTLRPEGLHLQMKLSNERPHSETLTVNTMRPEGVHLQMDYSECDSLTASPSRATVPRLRPEGLHFTVTPISESVSELGENEVMAPATYCTAEVPSFIEIPGPILKKPASGLGCVKIPRSPRRKHKMSVTRHAVKANTKICDTASTTSSTVCEMESVSEGSQSTNTLRPEGLHFLSKPRRHPTATNV